MAATVVDDGGRNTHFARSLVIRARRARDVDRGDDPLPVAHGAAMERSPGSSSWSTSA